MLVGRTAERARLRRLLDSAGGPRTGVGAPRRARHREARGPAGGGKRRARALGAGRGVRVAPGLRRARRSPAPGDRPRGPRIPTAQQAALRAALALGPPAGPDRFGPYTATLSLLGAVASEGPLLVVIDDAHWLDVPSQEALLFCARRIGDEPIAMVAASRERPPEHLDVSDIPELRVGGLSQEAARRLVTRAAREPLGPGVAERILSLAEGNPLALCELPRALSASERAGEAALPPTLHPGEALTRAYRRRLEALAPQSRRAVLLAFVSEDGALGRILAALGSAGAGSAALERAEAAGVLTLEQGRATPRHPLLRPIALDLFGPAARRAAHRALAECLEPERHGEQRAWHLAEAAVGPDERAAAALDHAAIAAAARTGYAAAARVIERAASLSEDEPNAWRRRAVAAQAALAAGRAAWASAILEPGPGARVPGPLEPEIAHLRGRLGFLTGHLDTAFELLTRDAERIAADDPARTSLMLADATLARSLSGDCYAALRTAERAYALGRAAGAAAPTVIGCLVLALALRGEARRARSLIDRFDELNSEIEPLSPAGQMAVVTTGSEAWLGDLDLATARVERWIARALEDGAVGFIAHPLWVACEIDFRAGRWARARARGEEAVALLVETGQTSTLGVALASLAIVEAGLGMPEAAVAHASEAGGSQSATASAAWASSRPRAAAFCTSA